VRARALRAPVFFRLINTPNGALRAPQPITASLILQTKKKPRENSSLAKNPKKYTTADIVQ